MTAISAVVARRTTMTAGWVTATTARLRPWVRLDVGLCDGTGTITLRFLGRTQIPGVVTGCHLTVEGTPYMDGETLVMLNPLYVFTDDQRHATCISPHGRPDGFER